MENEVFKDNEFIGKKVKTVASPTPNIGIDTDAEFIADTIQYGVSGGMNLSAITNFSQISFRRDQVYKLIDDMANDPIISAALETYAEDATERNEQGDIIWAESSDGEAAKYIQFLLDSLNINKYVYDWTYSLVKYGDIYVRMYRKSEINDGLFDEDNKKKDLNEDVNIKAYTKDDKYAHYVEMIPNPAEMFELTRFGKSYAYIQADTRLSTMNTTEDVFQTSQYLYTFKKGDINIYPATEFVHGSLSNRHSRITEEVEIFTDPENPDKKLSYKVNKGQSILYNIFKIWKELSLLETSIMLNRVTKSSITKNIAIEVGDMPKEKVGPYLNSIKTLFEQKTAMSVNNSMSEYNNPGPVENLIFTTTRNGKGSMSVTTVGGEGDANVSHLADLDYFKNKMYASLRIPKTYLGDTDDAAGFSGGESLALISSRYAKAVKRIQTVICQMVTDIINLMLIDKHCDKYIGKFTIKMVPPATKEEADRREALSNQLRNIADVKDLLSDIPDDTLKLKIIKELLSNAISNQEVIDCISNYIDTAESKESLEVEDMETEDKSLNNGAPDSGFSGDSSSDIEDTEVDDFDINTDVSDTKEDSADSYLPSPNDLGMDATDSE